MDYEMYSPPASMHLKTFSGDGILHVRDPVFGHGCRCRVQTAVVVNLVALVDEGSGDDGICTEVTLGEMTKHGDGVSWRLLTPCQNTAVSKISRKQEMSK